MQRLAALALVTALGCAHHKAPDPPLTNGDVALIVVAVALVGLYMAFGTDPDCRPVQGCDSHMPPPDPPR